MNPSLASSARSTNYTVILKGLIILRIPLRDAILCRDDNEQTKTAARGQMLLNKYEHNPTSIAK